MALVVRRDGLALVLIGVVIAFVVYRGQVAEQQALKAERRAFLHADQAACFRIEKLKAVARAQLNRALKTLPTLAYYKDHPAELRSARDQSLVQLHEFKPVRC